MLTARSLCQHAVGTGCWCLSRQLTVVSCVHTLPSVLYTDQQGVGGGNGERGRTWRGAGGGDGG